MITFLFILTLVAGFAGGYFLGERFGWLKGNIALQKQEIEPAVPITNDLKKKPKKGRVTRMQPDKAEALMQQEEDAPDFPDFMIRKDWDGRHL